MLKKLVVVGLSAMVAAVLLVGCGGGTTTTSKDYVSNSDTITGYFIDSAVEGIHYKTKSGLEGDTDEYGRFSYYKEDEVEFSLGKISLGKATPEANAKVTPKTLIAGTEEPNEEEKKRIALLLRVLQSLDSDNNASNGITIKKDVIKALESLDKEVEFKDINEDDLIELDNKLNIGLDEDYDGKLDVNETQAQEHFEDSVNEFDSGVKPDDNKNKGQEHSSSNEDNKEDNNKTRNPGNGNGQGQGNGQGNGNGRGSEDNNITRNPGNDSVQAELTQKLKDSLAYMGNEERLAYDVYMNLYDYYQKSGVEIKQFYNISTKSESKHISTVQELVKKYKLNVKDFTNVDESVVKENNMSAENMPSGVYDIAKIQELYNTLYALGQNSKEDALKVGCMVEVTDVNDLDEYIKQAQDSSASDVEEAFESLRKGSYNHYWAFDKALKNLGVANGCYYEGDELLTNKEGVYPKNNNGNGRGR